MVKVHKPIRKNNTYTIVSIRGNEEFFDGTYTRFKPAMAKARSIDSYISMGERKAGYRTEVWTNYNETKGVVQTIHVIKPRRA